MYCIKKVENENQLKLIPDKKTSEIKTDDKINVEIEDKKYQNASLLRKEKGANDIIETPDWLVNIIYNFVNVDVIKIKDKYPLLRDCKFSIIDPCSGLNNQMLKPFLIDNNYKCTGLEIRRSINENFLNYPTSNKFDFIIMNPPFNNLGAWEFIKKALKHLQETNYNTYIYCIVPDYVLYNSDNRKRELNNFVCGIKALPKTTFEGSGVKIHSSLVKLQSKSLYHFFLTGNNDKDNRCLFED